MPAPFVLWADLSDLQRAMIGAIARVFSGRSKPRAITAEEWRRLEKATSRAAWIGVDQLEKACPERFAETLAELVDDLELAVLWKRPNRGVFACLTPFGCHVHAVAIAEVRSWEDVPVPVPGSQPPRLELQKRLVRVPCWARPGSPLLDREQRQSKRGNERYLPWPEGIPDHRKGPLEQLVDEESNKPVLLFTGEKTANRDESAKPLRGGMGGDPHAGPGIPISVDPKLKGTGKAKGKRQAKRRKAG